MSFREWIDSLKVGDQVAIYRDKERSDFQRLDIVVRASKGFGGHIIVKGIRDYGSETYGRSGKRLSSDFHYYELWLSPVTDVELSIVRSRELIEQLKNKNFAGLSLKQLEAITKIIESGE